VTQLEDRQFLTLSVSYHGGPLIRNVQVETLYLGSVWGNTQQPTAVSLNSFFSYIANSPYMDMLGQYNVGRGQFIGTDTVTSQPSGNSITEARIQTILSQEIQKGSLAAPSANSLYVVFLPPRVRETPTDIGHHSQFLDSTSGKTITYAVIDDQLDPQGQIQVPQGAPSSLTAANQQTWVASHELAEAVTDPDTTTGWRDYTQTGGEIADIAQDTLPVGQVDGILNGYDVQKVWSNLDNTSILQGNPAPTLSSVTPAQVTVGNPSPITLTVTGSGFLRSSVVAWNSTALATSYVSPTQLTATVPASDFKSAGTAQITVSNPRPAGGTSTGLGFQVLQPTPATSTTTVVSSSVDPSVYGLSITFTAVVAHVAPGGGTPTGTVTFYDGRTRLGSTALNSSGHATFATTALAAGSHAITAMYSGDSTLAASSSTALTQTVRQDGTTIEAGSTIDSTVYGEAATFTARVLAEAPGGGTPAGSVTFYDGSTPLGSATLAMGMATFSTTKLVAGQHTIEAVYRGNGNFATSTAAALTQVVRQDGTTTTVISSKDPSASGQSITVTATVEAEAPGGGTPTGTVTFYDGSTSLASAVLKSSGRATFATKALAAGSHAITAVYDGDKNFTASHSTALTQAVQQDGATVTLASSKASSVSGEAVTFTAKVKVKAPGSGTPTGTVTFSDGTTILGIVPLGAAGTATFTTSGLSVGAHTITCLYSGDPQFASVASKALKQTVKQDGTKTVVVSSANPSGKGQAVTFTATVSAAAPGSGTPSGSVTFYDGKVILGTATLSGGIASLTVASLAKGKPRIKAVYGGDLGFKSSTSSALVQVVNSTPWGAMELAGAGFPASLPDEPGQAGSEAPMPMGATMSPAMFDQAIGGLNPSFLSGVMPPVTDASGAGTVAVWDQVLASWSRGRKPGSSLSSA
jgi:hypothetical protein